MRRVLISAALLLGTTVPMMTSGAEAAGPHSSFIVVLQPGTANVPGVADGLAASARGELGFVYEHALQGFSITATDAAAAGLARNPRVAYVERDQKVTLAEQETPTGIDRIFATGNTALGIDGTDDYRVDVDVAVIDTGVDFQHPDLNVWPGINCASGSPFRAKCQTGSNAGDDDHYHGTHVAGTIGALDNGTGVVGVAPGARIHPVKVLNSQGSGYTSWIVAGIDWVADPDNGIEVANMSLGGSGYSQAEYDAIQGAVDNGVAFAVAAGNSNADANNYSPAAFDNVLTVSALADFDGLPGGEGTSTCRADEDDTLANFSNWGSAVDIAAPGVCILSTYPIERGEYGTISGTSMASPHVAGALALLASAANPDTAGDVQDLYDAVTGAGNGGWTDKSGDPKEPLLDVSTFVAGFVPGLGGGGGPTPPVDGDTTLPVVTITSPSNDASFASGETITFTATATDDIDGGLTDSLTWTSSNGGQIGAGGSITVTLSDGPHTITASATDAALNKGSATINITVGTLVGTATSDKGTWTATVTNKGTTSVTGEWSDGTPAGCTIAPGTSCSLSGIPKKVASVTFAPTTGGSIVILKP